MIVTNSFQQNSSLANTQKFFHELCFAHNFEFSKQNLTQLTDADTADHLLSQDKERHTLYRDLVSESILSALRKAFSQSFEFLSEKELQTALREFLHQAPPSTRYYRDLAKEFLDFVQLTKDTTEIFISIQQSNPFWFELLQYEFSWYSLTFLNTQDAPKSNATNKTLSEVRVNLNMSLCLHEFSFAVQEISERQPPQRINTFLLLCRHPENFERQQLTLNALSFEFVLTLQNNPDQTLGEIFTTIQKSTPDTPIEALQSELLGLIKFLLEKGVVTALS